jgi:hypothetical protein
MWLLPEGSAPLWERRIKGSRLGMGEMSHTYDTTWVRDDFEGQ